ncbi:uncharacterized protein [Euphorbia lathyris]|uniref:uncharacterized protein n=1 Tax=Euphorbia lathyris TaxID=212925 RepID=UPI0033132F3C
MNNNTQNFRNPNGDSSRTGRPEYTFNNNYGRSYPSLPTFPRFSPPHPTLERSRGAYDPYWRSTDEIFTPRPLGIMGLPLQPPSRLEIHVINNMPQTSSAQEHSARLIQDEQKNALKRLRKEIYNPIPKRISSRLCLYYRDQAAKIVNDMEKGKEEGKRCAVCLEDFEAKEMVMVTPCNHMFHEECIVPWIKSHGQCPVCRFSIWEPSAGRSSTTTNDNNIGEDLISILRAMGAI